MPAFMSEKELSIVAVYFCDSDIVITNASDDESLGRHLHQNHPSRPLPAFNAVMPAFISTNVPLLFW